MILGLAILVWLTVLLPTNPLLAQSEIEKKPGRTAKDLMTPVTDKAIVRGLAFLSSQQNDDGTFGSGGYRSNVAISGLAGMSFISSGSTPGRGPYGQQINRSVQYILERTDDNGFIHAHDDGTRGPMYGHGFATLFLAEVYGMSTDPLVRQNLSNAVNLIINTQNAEGGWRYLPVRGDADISVTVCQVMALRAARNAGIFVPGDAIDGCIDYVKRSQNPDGGFMYRIRGGPSAFPRSAAGIVALYSAGVYQGDEIEKGLRYLMQHIPNGDRIRRESHYFYGHYYAVQAMWQAGGEYWTNWYPAVRDELIERQDNDGSWVMTISPEYGTAMATLILQLPNNQLPIFQR